MSTASLTAQLIPAFRAGLQAVPLSPIGSCDHLRAIASRGLDELPDEGGLRHFEMSLRHREPPAFRTASHRLCEADLVVRVLYPPLGAPLEARAVAADDAERVRHHLGLSGNAALLAALSRPHDLHLVHLKEAAEESASTTAAARVSARGGASGRFDVDARQGDVLRRRLVFRWTFGVSWVER